MFKFFGVQRASAMEVNAYVHLQSTVVLRMGGEFSVNTAIFVFEHMQQLEVF